MGLDRLDADIEYLRDLLVSVALGDQPNDSLLAAGQGLIEREGRTQRKLTPLLIVARIGVGLASPRICNCKAGNLEP